MSFAENKFDTPSYTKKFLKDFYRQKRLKASLQKLREYIADENLNRKIALTFSRGEGLRPLSEEYWKALLNDQEFGVESVAGEKVWARAEVFQSKTVIVFHPLEQVATRT